MRMGETATAGAPDELEAATAEGNTTGNDEARTAAGASGGVVCANRVGAVSNMIVKLANVTRINLHSLSDVIGARRIDVALGTGAIATPARKH